MPEVQFQSDGMAPEAAQAEAAKVEAAKAELAEEATQSGAPEPGSEKILGKYSTVDDLIQAHKSLQAEYTRIRQGLPPKEDAQQTQPEQPAPQPQGESEQPEQPEGNLNPETARRMIEGIVGAAGGQEKFQAIKDWANSGKVPEERRAAFNQALQQGDVENALTQFKAIQYDYITEHGWEPPLTRGRESTQTTQPFRSDGEAKAAMLDPRFDSSGPAFDLAYHNDVVARLAASPGVLQVR